MDIYPQSLLAEHANWTEQRVTRTESQTGEQRAGGGRRVEKKVVELEVREMRAEGIVRSLDSRSWRSPAAQVICHDPPS